MFISLRNLMTFCRNTLNNFTYIIYTFSGELCNILQRERIEEL